MVGAGGLRRAGPAPHPGPVREAHDRPPVLRRHLDLHPAEGQPGRCHPGHLRVVAAVHPGADRAVLRRPTSGWATLDRDRTSTKGDHPIYIATYFLLIVFFAFFYVAISFNPEEVADNMKKYGGFIPGIRAGRPTAEYLQLRAQPHHLAGFAVPGPDRSRPDDRAGRLHGSTRTSRSAAPAS